MLDMKNRLPLVVVMKTPGSDFSSSLFSAWKNSYIIIVFVINIYILRETDAFAKVSCTKKRAIS